MAALLPSWRPGTARDRILAFLDQARHLPEDRRVAVFGHGGTLWCERPDPPQYAFFIHELRSAMATNPALANRADYQTLLDRGTDAIPDFGLRRAIMMMSDILTEMTPEEFTARVRSFMSTQVHPDRGVPYPALAYQPMRELTDTLRTNGFAVFITTAGGMEFVRAFSEEVHGVPPEGVVGTHVGYRYEIRDGQPVLVRIAQITTELNEGPAQVILLQTQLGRRPILAAGNSVADRAMLEYTTASGDPSLALLINHDDPEREYAYDSTALAMPDTEPILDVARQAGWTVVSMRDDWATIFPDGSAPSSR